MSSAVSVSAPVSDFTYTACYCEENIYKLCNQLVSSGKAAENAADLFVVFISNEDRTVPIWRQRAGSRDEAGLVVWDYHVICIQISPEGAEPLVWDLDTTLCLPECFSKYVNEAFRPWLNITPFQRLYRVIAAAQFLKFFASDRRHMKTPEGSFKMPPPPYDCIQGEDGSVHNLDDYITMSQRELASKDHLTKVVISQSRLGIVLNDTNLQFLFQNIN